LYVEKIFRGPQEDDKVTERVLARMEVVDCFDVETLCLADVLENLPIGACRSVVVVSTVAVYK
jgi:hypothetical protein